MPAPSQTIGTKLTAASGAWHVVAVNEQRALGDPAWIAPSAGWITRLGVWARDTSNIQDGRLYLAVWAVTGAGEPGTLLGRTGPIPVSIANAGASAEGAIVSSHASQGGPLTAIRVTAGQALRPGFRVDSRFVEIAAPTGSVNLTHHRRVVASGYPTDPFLPAATVTEPAAGIWFEFIPDTAPNVPTGQLPAAGAAVNPLTPTLEAAFTDDDTAAPTSDKIREYQIEVRDATTLADLWSGPAATFAASASERTAARFSRVYAGTALTGGRVIQVRERVADDPLLYSAWAAWRTVTINALGQVDVSTSSPNGKVETDPALIVWGAKWHHPQGYSTDRVQVRILESGVVLKLGAEVTKAIASSALPGTAFTITAAEAGIGKLDPDAYTYQVRGRAVTGGQWSPWSAERVFSVNAPPTVPVNLQPPSGAASTTRPLLEFESADPDADDVEGVDVVWNVEITTPGGVTTVYQTAVYDAARGVASLQTTSTHLATTGVYTWRARGHDVSAGTLGASAWSPSQTFTYTTGPVATITSPANGATVTTSTPTIAFTVSGGTMASFLARLYVKDATRVLYESARVVSGTGLWTVPAGVLKNNTAYDAAIVARDTLNNDGASLRQAFTVAYTAPVAPPSVNATPYQNAGDPEPTSMLLTWGPGSYPPGEHAGWRIYRRAAGDPVEDATLVRRIESVVQTRWLDHHAPMDGPQTWGVTQLRRVGLETLESPPVEITAELDFRGIALAAVTDGGSRRAVLYWEAGTSRATLAAAWEDDDDTVVTWGSDGLGVPLRRTGVTPEKRSYSGVLLRSDAWGDADAHRDTLVALKQRKDILSVRSRREPRMWGTLTSLSITREGDGYSVDVEIIERYYVESEDRNV